MRALLWTIILAFAAWSGWWFYASSTAKSGAELAFTEAKAAGWQAEHGGIAVAGYPNRIDLTVTQPDVATPDRVWGYRGPFLQLFALSYKPWHLIAALPQEQTLTTPLGQAQLTASKLQSSLILVPGTDLTLDRSQLIGEGVGLSGSFGQFMAARVSLATRPALAGTNAHDIGAEIQGLSLPESLQARLPAELFAPGAARLHLDGEASFDRPLDRHFATTLPQVTRLTLRGLTASWGAASVTLRGALQPDAQGFASGQLELEMAGGLELLDAATQLGLLHANDARNLSLLVAMASGSGKPLTLPLVLANGAIRLGPVTLGQAPRMR